MGDPLTQGHAFESGDLWQGPQLLNTLGDGTIFSPIDLTLPDLEDADEQEAVFDLQILDLTLEDSLSEPQKSLEYVSAPQSIAGDQEAFLLDAWDLEGLLDAEKEAPKLQTWEAFEKQDVESSRELASLSEAGPEAFDAYITAVEPRDETGVLPQDYTLRALCNLASGRASTLFQWNESKNTFEQTLVGVAISGSSKMCSESFVQELIELGTSIARLRAFTVLPRSLSKQCTAFLAMQNCVAEMLDAVDESITSRLAAVRSLVQLYSLVQQPQRLVHTLLTLSKIVEGQESDEALIASLSERIQLDVRIAPNFRSTLHALLARVSGPWLEQLASDMGFGNSATTLASGESTQDLMKGATFINSEDGELIKEIRLAVSVLREQSPAHLLLTHGRSGEKSPLSCFGGPESTAQQPETIADTYRIRMLSKMKGKRLSDADFAIQDVETETLLDHRVWHDEAFREDYFGRLKVIISSDVATKPDLATDRVRSQVLSLCLNSPDIDNDSQDLSTDLHFTPLEHVRPLIRTQNRLLNGVLMRQLFRDHKLREHLVLQRSFHLFGNGEFVSRLSTALFSQDVQSAERRRGKPPTSETMGLRLGTTHEERWPPASSELQLTLMGILIDTYKGHQAGRRSSVQASDMPGSLSFSIRELPEQEIDRVLDPNSIYALDFLRLQYNAQAPLNSILTPDAMQKYDDIFKYLLRLLRVVHVTADVGRKAAARRNETVNENAAMFAHAANHLILVLLSHAMDLGITAPWRALMDSIHELEQTLSEEDATDEMGLKLTVGMEGLRQLHDSCLERIRNRLFLKRKQEKLRNALESTLSTLLKSAFAIHRDDSSDGMPQFTSAHQEFSQSLSKFLGILREQAQKPPKAIAVDDIADAEMLRLLLARLNWNEHYQ